MTFGNINQLNQYPTQVFAPLFPAKDPILERLDRIESALRRIEAALDKRDVSMSSSTEAEARAKWWRDCQDLGW